MSDVARVIARVIAKDLIETHGNNVENLTVYETVPDEIPGADPEFIELVEKFVFSYIETARVHVELLDFRVKDDGSVKPEEEFMKDMEAPLNW